MVTPWAFSGSDVSDRKARSGEHVIDPHQRGKQRHHLRPGHIEGAAAGGGTVCYTGVEDGAKASATPRGVEVADDQ